MNDAILGNILDKPFLCRLVTRKNIHIGIIPLNAFRFQLSQRQFIVIIPEVRVANGQDLGFLRRFSFGKSILQDRSGWGIE